MKNFLMFICIFLFPVGLAAHTLDSLFLNIWEEAPRHIPCESSTDAPLMGNGDLGMCVGFERGLLRYFLSKNDFWRLQSKADHLSGPRVGGYVDIRVHGFESSGLRAEQSLDNGVTTCFLKLPSAQLHASSWVSATENMIFITLCAYGSPVRITWGVNAPANEMACLETGERQGMAYMTRAFIENVDIPTMIAVAVKSDKGSERELLLNPGESVHLFVGMESRFKKKNPLNHVLRRVCAMDEKGMAVLKQKHDAWWKSYWEQSSLRVDDDVLMKAYRQGLYIMAACSRDRTFPPALFGWVTTDKPSWNGDYHLNYNFYAPFYGLYSANRIEQACGQETPLLDFMARGRWYAERVTGTRGILYPVGIGPLGVEVTRDFPVGEDNGYTLSGDVEAGGLFYKQRSHALFGTVNMAQHWRHTYDKNYGKRIYPYVLAVADFWEDFLVFEDGQYQIYRDADSEKSGFTKNPGMSIALLKNALELAIDLSETLGKDEDRRAKWQDIIEHLRPLPTYWENGECLLRGAEENERGEQIYGISFSMIYPANGVTLDSDPLLLATARNTIDRIQQWQHHNATNSFYPAAVRVGYDSEVIWEKLHEYARHTYPNGFQLDNPHGIENASTVVNTLNEMVCMSVGHKIRLFVNWPRQMDVKFEKLRAWGAFLVSAELQEGIVRNVFIFSEKGRPCRIVNPWQGKKVQLWRNGMPSECISGEVLCFQTSKDETIQVKPL